jgi:hypothetical protein
MIHLHWGMDDPFILLHQKRPNSTMTTPNWDIDYVLTYGINAINITTMVPNFPVYLDHLGITLDIDLSTYFSSSYSELSHQDFRVLTSGNQQSTKKYLNYVTEQINNHKLVERIKKPTQIATSPLAMFPATDALQLDKIEQLMPYSLAKLIHK